MILPKKNNDRYLRPYFHNLWKIITFTWFCYKIGLKFIIFTSPEYSISFALSLDFLLSLTRFAYM